MWARTAAGILCLVCLATPVLARDAVSREARGWVADAVRRVEGAAARVAASSGTRWSRSVDVHVRIGADGALLDHAFGNPPSPEAVERRLRAAVSADSPFPPPPQEVLALDGSVSLDFTLGRL